MMRMSILQKYIHDEVGLHNDHKGISKDNLDNVIWDVYNDDDDDDVDVVSMCGMDGIKVDNIEDNQEMLRWVGMCLMIMLVL